MYTEAGILFPYMHSFSQDMQQLEEYCNYQHKTSAPMNNITQTSIISEYDLGEEGDLFKAPEPIMEETHVGLDPMTVATSMISSGEQIIDLQGMKMADIESIQNDQLLSEVFYACKKDLMEKAAIEFPLSDVLDLKIPHMNNVENHIQENKVFPTIPPLGKSVSSICLGSMDLMPLNPSFLDFSEMDFGTAHSMRRSHSEGDIKAVGDNSTILIHSPVDRPPMIGSCSAEVRQEKLSRYRNKKSRRNFGRKIKYACRKALADNQPRIRGRFARTTTLML